MDLGVDGAEGFCPPQYMSHGTCKPVSPSTQTPLSEALHAEPETPNPRSQILSLTPPSTQHHPVTLQGDRLASIIARFLTGGGLLQLLAVPLDEVGLSLWYVVSVDGGSSGILVGVYI